MMPKRNPYDLDMSPKDRTALLRDLNNFDAWSSVHKNALPNSIQEASEEIQKRIPPGIEYPRIAKNNTHAFYLPIDPLDGSRDIAVGTGHALVGTDLPPGFISYLGPRALANVLGVRNIPGLVANYAKPRELTGVTSYWVEEGSAVTADDPEFSQVTGAPHFVGTHVLVSRRASVQIKTPTIVDMLALGIGRAVSTALLAGTGADGQPQGIIGLTGVGTVTGTSLAWAGVLEFESDVAAASADLGPMAWVTTAAVRKTLKSREKIADTASFLCEPSNMMAGYPVFPWTAVPANHIILGSWNQAAIGEWGPPLVIIDPYAYSVGGFLKFTVLFPCDIIVDNPESFSVATNFT